MGFFNKIKNLSLPLIKVKLDYVSSYYVLLNIFHIILSNFTYPMVVKPHRVFSPWGKNPAENRKFKKKKKKKLILFERILKFKYNF